MMTGFRTGSRTRRAARWRLVAALAALSLVALACGADGDDARLASSGTSSTTASGVGSGDKTPAGEAEDGKGSVIELAATPDFCEAATLLIGDMQAIGVVDPTEADQLALAYGTTEDSLGRVAELAPNAGLRNLIGRASDLFLPVVDLLRAADWRLDDVDPDRIGELEAFGADGEQQLAALTDELETYLAAECGTDVAAARQAGVERFRDRLGTGAAAGSDGADASALPDQADIDAAPLGQRGGQVFCDADRLWSATVQSVDEAEVDGAFVDHLLRLADVSTTWGERLPVELAVVSVDINVGFAEVVVTFGETQDAAASHAAYQAWRSSPGLAEGRRAIDGWVAENC